jgi:hypothetical protein
VELTCSTAALTAGEWALQIGIVVMCLAAFVWALDFAWRDRTPPE